MTSATPSPQPVAQQILDADKNQLITAAEEHGWELFSRDPVVLLKADKAILIQYNSAGMLHSAHWLGGQEFAGYGSGGVLHRSDLDAWFAWEPQA